MTLRQPARVSDFDYELPPELIAQHPLPQREDSRMMVIDRSAGTVEHRRFREFPEYMAKGEILALNDTRVLPAKLWGLSGEARIEFLFIREVSPGVWDVLCRPARRVREGDEVRFPGGIKARVGAPGEDGRRRLDLGQADVRGLLCEKGFAPLPPYIKRAKQDERTRPEDIERYQTVFARKEGAIAAPTAGLHFTAKILKGLEAKGVDICRVTLDVGLATFQPVRAELIADHKMLEETYSVAPAEAGAINVAKEEGRPVTAVGTTVVRTLESAWRDGAVHAGRRSTALDSACRFE